MQSRESIDIEQIYQVWRQTNRQYLASYRGGMGWKTVAGKEYLYRITNRTGGAKSLGPRSPETESLHTKFHEGKIRAKERLQSLAASLQIKAGAAQAAKIARVPAIVANVLRKLDQEESLGKNLTVIGTNAVYAYEAAAGCMVDTGLTATTDCDFIRLARETSAFRPGWQSANRAAAHALVACLSRPFLPPLHTHNHPRAVQPCSSDARCPLQRPAASGC